MNFIIWNARGANSSEFRRHYAEMVKLHKPVMLVLLKTRINEHKHPIHELGFFVQIQSPAIGLSRGIVGMWKDDLFKIHEVSSTTQGINVMVQVIVSSNF